MDKEFAEADSKLVILDGLYTLLNMFQLWPFGLRHALWTKTCPLDVSHLIFGLRGEVAGRD